MFHKTNEVKVLRDPIHGYIHVEYQVVWDVINNRWFQRLRRIRQLGGASVVYHTAEHTRFSHSLGVYELVRRMVTEIPDLEKSLNQREKMIAMLAGLLHDIGHGPYSHALEAITNENHEVFTCRIIEENTEITEILNRASKGLAKEVADVIRHESQNPLLSQLISSQLDADRMDYLLRDAYFTGTKYGEFDLERILRVIRVHDDRQLVVKESGVYAVENYIMARYHMYWQVYYHPVARAFESILHSLFRRLKDIPLQGERIEIIEPILQGKKLELEEYFRLDEYAFSYAFGQWVSHPDSIIADLCGRLRDRDLFDYVDYSTENQKKIAHILQRKGLDEKYYLTKDLVNQKPYQPYVKNEQGAIWVRLKNGVTKELESASVIVGSLTRGKDNDDNKIFFPKEVRLESDD
ncbi:MULTISPECIES: HD domain-containing protein [Terrabacteria group]|uniref:HD domain-containing protein n=1 Tax=Bacillati TaxID=1783272 RepID=UPI001C6EBD7A|nr:MULTISPECIES: HD domain-containing protein [Terrabacteria group]MBW9212923.1 HD domain-containing protein [Trueperella sp. zg.1013]